MTEYGPKEKFSLVSSSSVTWIFSLSSSLLVTGIRATSWRIITKLFHKLTCIREDKRCGCVWHGGCSGWSTGKRIPQVFEKPEREHNEDSQLEGSKDQNKTKLKRWKMRGEKNRLCLVYVVPVMKPKTPEIIGAYCAITAVYCPPICASRTACRLRVDQEWIQLKKHLQQGNFWQILFTAEPHKLLRAQLKEAACFFVLEVQWEFTRKTCFIFAGSDNIAWFQLPPLTSEMKSCGRAECSRAVSGLCNNL